LKRRLLSLFNSLKERSILTPEEKRVLCFVLMAFLLGVTVKHYRDAHRETSLPANANHPSARSDHATTSPQPKKTYKKQRKKTSDATRPAESKERD
jgi:hypothetical protein